MRKSRAGHSSNAHSSISMSSSTKGVQSRTRLVDCNQGWRGPVISDSELAKLGSEAELLRVSHLRTPDHALLCHTMMCHAMPCHDMTTKPCRYLPCYALKCPIMLWTSLSILTSPPPHPHTTIPQAAPPGVSVSDICEGKHSYKTFQPIHTAFPWDNPKHSKPILGKTGGSHWNIRRALMQATASLSQQGQGQIRSERQPVPLLRNQQPQFSSWNKGNPTLNTL